ncbi:tetratricopeptide repeat protein [Novosphingobium sp. B1]|uniref:tetratricopeptide repeat protein n=1 Tax=Novosphingobium sp. B1 TaxID=1938756 RepID=UPI0009D7DEF5|nr:tetratricopeptide repeat protein [Novosphingobium sp. B1]SMC98535.1 Tetratricopeptide repeat-containing protein [Novosphingobium sp. B1]
MTAERGRKWPWILMAAVFLVTAASIVSDKIKARQGPPDPLPAEVKPWFGPRNQTEALTAADNGVANARGRLQNAPDEWLRLEMLGRALAARFRISGSYADLAEADAVLARGMANSEPPAGPSLSRATVAVLAHRLDAADAALKRFDSQKGEPTKDEEADGWAIKGDIGFQRGDIKRARLAYARAEEVESNASIALRQSMLALRTGDPLLARRRVNAVLRAGKLTRSAKAQAALMRATIAYGEGDWKTAGVWARFADGFFPGNPLAMAYVAQQRAVDGDPAGAVKQYEAILANAPLPEIMDALAFTLRLQGKGAESRVWANKAGALWTERYRQLPEAAAAHLVEHELALGDPAKALPIAAADATRRPHGASLILLARARLLTGDAKGALATLARAEKTGWRSAGLYLALADVHTALGDTDAADDAREEALDLNPKATDPAARFIWFGHD